MHAFFGFSHPFRRLAAAVVIAAEPVVPGHFWVAIIAFEIAVMQLMMERPDLQVGLIPQHEIFKPGMRGRRCQREPISHEDEVDRM